MQRSKEGLKFNLNKFKIKNQKSIKQNLYKSVKELIVDTINQNWRKIVNYSLTWIT